MKIKFRNEMNSFMQDLLTVVIFGIAGTFAAFVIVCFYSFYVWTPITEVYNMAQAIRTGTILGVLAGVVYSQFVFGEDKDL